MPIKIKKYLLKYFYKPFVFCLFLFLLFLVVNYIFPLNTEVYYSKTITNSKREIIYSFLTEDEKWRMFTELDEISPELKKAIIYKEDKYFYWHFGVNPVAIGRAFINNILKRKRTSGASTITMQVARLLNPKKRTYLNKLIEMFNAFQLEWKYSKAEILQLYLNLVPYGSNIEGVKSASVLYLGNPPNHLSLAEITALSIIPNRPTSLLPGKNNTLITKERNKWLKIFQKNKVFENQVIKDALSEEFNAKRRSSPKIAPHFSYRMKNKFPKMNNIHTSINIDFQKKVEEIAKNFIRTYGALNINNTSILVINNQTMEVLAYVGSNNFYDNENAGQVDGINSIRQPGSTLKPLLYALAIDKGNLTPKTVVTDVPINYDGYSPVNYNEKYNGYVTIEYALAQSLNVPAVKTLNKLGVETLTKKLIESNFKSIERQEKHLGLSVILGGCGVTLEELTTLYASFANKGKYKKINWLVDKDVNIEIQDTLISEKSAFMISEMMTNLERPDLPGFWENTKNLPKIAWKTGTSYGRKDAWSIGFNNKYTVGVWVGNFSGEGVPDMTGSRNASPILFNVFKAIDSEHSKYWLKKPKDLDIRIVCSETGLIPSENCKSEIFDYFIPLVSSNKVCQHLTKVYISANDSISYCMDCRPNTSYKTKWFSNHSAEIIGYFESENIGYKKIPTHNPKCEHIHQSGEPIITAPKDGTTYYIDKDYPEEIMLRCQASKDATTVFWYINDVFYKSCAKTETIFFEAKQGQNKISCSDDLGRNTNIWFDVEYISL